MKEKLKELAKSIGLLKVGITEDDEGNMVVVALFPYFVAGEIGNLAMYARGYDYHKLNEKKLKILSGFLLENGAARCKIFVDNSARDDRLMAYRAGLGFFGKNNLLICEEFGSYFTIGQIVTDIEIEADMPQERSCDNCGACIKNCPGGALHDFKREIGRASCRERV